MTVLLLTPLLALLNASASAALATVPVEVGPTAEVKGAAE